MWCARQQAARTVRTAVAAIHGSLDKLLAPVALYPDQLLAQMLLCSGDPRGRRAQRVAEEDIHSEGQRAAEGRRAGGLRAELRRARALPAGRRFMARQPTWTSQLGEAFAADRGAVFDAIQRLRHQARRGQPEEHAAADGRRRRPPGRRAGDRDRAGEPAGGLRPAIQPHGGVHAGASPPAPTTTPSSCRKTTTRRPPP